MKYSKSEKTGGKWVDKEEIQNGQKVTIVSETRPVASEKFVNERTGAPVIQNICKVQLEGETEPVNMSLTKPTIEALVDVYGEDSIQWQGHPLTVHKSKAPKGWSVQLVPVGYELGYDGDYVVIKKSTSGRAGIAYTAPTPAQEHPFGEF